MTENDEIKPDNFEMKIDADKYIELKSRLIKMGYAHEIDWAETIKPCDNSETFAFEAIWVICNSGMKNQIAQQIYTSILTAISTSQPIEEVFNHQGKVKAIKFIMDRRDSLFDSYLNAQDKTEFLQTLPYIGKITKYHLAKNLGLDCCKPDRHLVRIANENNLTPVELCQQLCIKTGDRVGTVDLVLWRAANLRLI